MVKDQVIDVKVRLKDELHKKLKAKAQQQERSMNYLINKAVELLVNKDKGVKK
ncbi:toxin-antitoxin system HicB family antitoxin [Acinetobacter sp. Ac_3412]|uniref:toxin-antitoxin system HicB family antitoxin n=1 Tax=Acinetobacter sp. Ac_3412 TaxID=1848935 RepID=UPI0014904EE4|nr:toxin-antitoxin system HicB family antitoxin [Acinetobacter sp. Ac_3412]